MLVTLLQYFLINITCPPHNLVPIKTSVAGFFFFGTAEVVEGDFNHISQSVLQLSQELHFSSLPDHSFNNLGNLFKLVLFEAEPYGRSLCDTCYGLQHYTLP